MRSSLSKAMKHTSNNLLKDKRRFVNITKIKQINLN